MGTILDFGIKFGSADMKTANLRFGNADMKAEPLEWRSRAAEPIKSEDDINVVIRYLMERGEMGDTTAYRNLLMFICGITFGLRCSDLTQLKFGDLLTKDWSLRNSLWIREIKTARKRGAKDKIETETGEIQYKLKDPREVFVTPAVESALVMYCKWMNQHGKSINRDDYLFPGQNPGTSLTYDAVYDIFTKLLYRNRKNKKPGVLVARLSQEMPIHASTHMLRKTFAYHFIMNASERNRAIEYLQLCLGHSNSLTTLRYAGITNDEISDVVLKMNLGGKFLALNTDGMINAGCPSANDHVIDLFYTDKDEAC